MRIFITTIFILSLSCPQANAGEIIQNASHQIAINEQISENIVEKAIESGLWNPQKTALALTIKKTGGTLCYVLIEQSPNDFMIVDVRNVESANFGKLGPSRSYYDRYETVPARWLERDDFYYQVEFRTRAWKDGQKYTVEEIVLIKSDGTPLWR